MEHLFNCHGEWLYILQVLAVLPFVGIWARRCICRIKKHEAVVKAARRVAKAINPSSYLEFSASPLPVSGVEPFPPMQLIEAFNEADDARKQLVSTVDSLDSHDDMDAS